MRRRRSDVRQHALPSVTTANLVHTTSTVTALLEKHDHSKMFKYAASLQRLPDPVDFYPFAAITSGVKCGRTLFDRPPCSTDGHLQHS